MSPTEVLFFREHEADIQEGANLLPILHEAARLGYVSTISLLHARGFLVSGTDGRGWNALFYAADGGHLELIRFLVEKAGSDVRSRTDKRITALMLGIRNGHTEVVRYLLDRGANTNARTTQGITPLMYAAARGNPEILNLLLERGASVDLSDTGGKTALDYSADETIRGILGPLSKSRRNTP